MRGVALGFVYLPYWCEGLKIIGTDTADRVD